MKTLKDNNNPATSTKENQQHQYDEIGPDYVNPGFDGDTTNGAERPYHYVENGEIQPDSDQQPKELR